MFIAMELGTAQVGMEISAEIGSALT